MLRQFPGARVVGRIQNKRPMVTRSLGPLSGFELVADAVTQAFRCQHLYVGHPREYPADYLFAAMGLTIQMHQLNAYKQKRSTWSIKEKVLG